VALHELRAGCATLIIAHRLSDFHECGYHLREHRGCVMTKGIMNNL
jgi:ABC-type transport system involved in Fe-S cluster assembly fused permease/ATPase subunit